MGMSDERRVLFTEKYAVVTHYQHPGTGDTEPVILNVSRSDTIGDVIDWYKANGGGVTISDLRIVSMTEYDTPDTLTRAARHLPDTTDD